MPVYFIQDEIGEIKIGYSDGNPYGRLRTFQTGNPRELKMLTSIPGGLAEEQALHARFAELRGKGEWFKPDARMLGFIEGMKYAYRDQQPKPIDAAEESALMWDRAMEVVGVIRVSEALDAIAGAQCMLEYAMHEIEVGRAVREDLVKFVDDLRAFLAADMAPGEDGQLRCDVGDPVARGARAAIENWRDDLGPARTAAEQIRGAQDLLHHVSYETTETDIERETH